MNMFAEALSNFNSCMCVINITWAYSCGTVISPILCGVYTMLYEMLPGLIIIYIYIAH